jgi:sporulation protein YlmC with PRC-barrel domain
MNKLLVASLAASVVAAGAAYAQAAHVVNLQNTDMLSSNVVGVDVYDMSNNDLGKIKDIAFDSNKTVKGYIVSVGGMLGVGARYVAVDPDSVKIKYDASDKKWHANMQATEEQLKSWPEFKYDGQWDASKS